MTAAVGIDVGVEINLGARIAAEGRAVTGIGIGQSSAAIVLSSSKGPSAERLRTNHENSTPSTAGTESFRSRWQSMVNALETGPAARQTTGLSVGRATCSRAGQGTGIKTRLSTGTEAESAGEQADVSGELGGAVDASLPQGSKSSSAAVSLNVDAAPRWIQVTEQRGEPVAGTAAAMSACSESGISKSMVAAPQVHPTTGAPRVEAGADARTGRSAKSEKRDSTSQQLKGAPQASAGNNGTLTPPIEVRANPLTPAPAIQAQIPATNLLAAPQPKSAERVLSQDRGSDTVTDAVAGSATAVRSGATGTAGIAAQTQMNARAATGNSVTATPGGLEDGATGGVQAFAVGDAAASDAKQQTGLPRTMGTRADVTQQGQAPSQHRTGSGSSLAEAAKAPPANSGTYQEPDGISALTFQSPILATAAEKPRLDGARQLPEAATARLAHRDSAGDVAQPAAHVVPAQQVGAGGEASGLVRVPAGTEGTTGALTAHAGAAAGTADQTFAVIDAGTRVGTPGWIHAGGQTAEAGFQDPALGWVGVKADLSAGGVHASLVPGSAEAAQTLSGHLAGLNAYLALQHTPVATLTLAAPSGRGVETGAGQSAPQGADQNPGQDAERNLPAQSQSSPQAGTATIHAATARVAESGNGGFDTVARMGEMRGRHISVMA